MRTCPHCGSHEPLVTVTRHNVAVRALAVAAVLVGLPALAWAVWAVVRFAAASDAALAGEGELRSTGLMLVTAAGALVLAGVLGIVALTAGVRRERVCPECEDE